MQKYTKLQEGTFVKNGKEYDYQVEIADDFPKKKEGNVRLRIMEERPAIHKVRTRYDPEIEMYGDKNASMEILLGYDEKSMKKTLRYLLYSLLIPFYIAGLGLSLIFIDRIPSGFLPKWTIWVFIPMLAVLGVVFFIAYFRINIITLAEYLKARDIKKILDKKGFKQ